MNASNYRIIKPKRSEYDSRDDYDVAVYAFELAKLVNDELPPDLAYPLLRAMQDVRPRTWVGAPMFTMTVER